MPDTTETPEHKLARHAPPKAWVASADGDGRAIIVLASGCGDALTQGAEVFGVELDELGALPLDEAKKHGAWAQAVARALSGVDSGGGRMPIAIPSYAWGDCREAIEGRWPVALVVLDLRFWDGHDSPTPLARDLAKTWGWSRSEASRFIDEEHWDSADWMPKTASAT